MGILGSIISIIAGIGSLVCFILVLVQMFQRGETTMGIVCIVLTFCALIGPLITFIYGWVKSGQWGIKNIMVAWTVCIVLGFVGAALNPAQFQIQAIQVPAR